jgi:hypothetical protein
MIPIEQKVSIKKSMRLDDYLRIYEKIIIKNDIKGLSRSLKVLYLCRQNRAARPLGCYIIKTRLIS